MFLKIALTLCLISIILNGSTLAICINKCLNIGDKCSLADASCPDNAYCNPTSSVCVLKVAPGGPCTFITPCLNSYQCINSTCQAAAYLGVDEVCETTLQCNSGLECRANICTNANYPSCSSSFVCRHNETCQSNNCVLAVSNTKQCTTSDQCRMFSTCSKPSVDASGRCSVPYGVQKGGSCSMDNTYGCDVSANLTCALNNTCVEFALEICTRVNSSAVKTSLSNLQQCQIDFQCPAVSNPAVPKSCFMRQCPEVIRNLTIASGGCPSNDTISTNTTTTTTTGTVATTSTTSSSTTTATSTDPPKNECGQLVMMDFNLIIMVLLAFIFGLPSN
ncbi:hypothetical protein SAMD00019534_068370 [Acytostelium subglobosum LB1]|uniref:hypothetical protein n=1 Tax=Acytostelium subglobosum LB1 TaxID=1410327 RepID=UPI000644B81E|nr:hypothetical protein SAMD00019534_068370 [Acytostelium subglobosum LB1]GAM23662.1 hypothetical protein SAMD00019534_068370 [Acytostelium subglobosum LB1]|eukprot:XP_012753403.1 hypothetical protein SAMD00019534_068370 [Acytostelium subglobosum LB1]